MKRNHKVKTVNVVVLEKSKYGEVSVDEVISFEDTEKGCKAANDCFKKKLAKLYGKDYDEHIDSTTLQSAFVEGCFDGNSFHISLN